MYTKKRERMKKKARLLTIEGRRLNFGPWSERGYMIKPMF